MDTLRNNRFRQGRGQATEETEIYPLSKGQESISAFSPVGLEFPDCSLDRCVGRGLKILSKHSSKKSNAQEIKEISLGQFPKLANLALAIIKTLMLSAVFSVFLYLPAKLVTLSTHSLTEQHSTPAQNESFDSADSATINQIAQVVANSELNTKLEQPPKPPDQLQGPLPPTNIWASPPSSEDLVPQVSTQVVGYINVPAVTNVSGSQVLYQQDVVGYRIDSNGEPQIIQIDPNGAIHIVSFVPRTQKK